MYLLSVPVIERLSSKNICLQSIETDFHTRVDLKEGQFLIHIIYGLY